MTRRHWQGALWRLLLPPSQWRTSIVRSCFAALLALPLSNRLAQALEPAVPETLGVDRVSGILGRPVYGLLGLAGRLFVVVPEGGTGAADYQAGAAVTMTMPP